jgi:hypothetical protein
LRALTVSSRLETGASDDFVQFLGGLGHLAQLSGNSVEIPGRRSTAPRLTRRIESERLLRLLKILVRNTAQLRRLSFGAGFPLGYLPRRRGHCSSCTRFESLPIPMVEDVVHRLAHGTLTRWLEGCDCDPCREAQNDAARALVHLLFTFTRPSGHVTRVLSRHRGSPRRCLPSEPCPARIVPPGSSRG